jgi:type VI secretion system secreted protein Hcp
MARAIRRRSRRPRSNSLVQAAWFEPVERRLLMTTQAHFVPDPLTGNPPTGFEWNIPSQGGTRDDFSPAQRALLETNFAAGGHQMFLKLTGIGGESVDAKHTGEIDVAGFEWATDRTVGGAGPDFDQLHLVSRVSKASPLLMSRLMSGAAIADADLVVRRAGGDQREFYKLFLDDARVGSYRVDTGEKGQFYEEFTLAFSRARVEYIPLSASGVPQAPVVFQWDVPTQGHSVGHFAPPQRAALHGPNNAFAGQRMFLRLDGVEGESTDAKHAGEIDVRGFEWQLTGARGSVPATSGEIHITAPTSKASPQLMQRLASGATIPNGDLVIRRDGGTQHMFFRLDLDDVRVSSYEITSAEHGVLLDEITLRFNTADLAYTPVNPDTGVPQAPVTFAWDFAKQGTPVQGFAPPQRELLVSSPDQRPMDMFLRLDGIQGDSADAKHAGHIDLAAFEWVMDRDFNSTGGPAFGEIHVSAALSKASPLLMHRMASGQVIPNGDLLLRRPEQSDFYRLDLSNVTVGSYRVTSTNGVPVVEEFTLRFESLGLDYTWYDANGIPRPPVSFDWSLPAQGGTTQAFAPQQRAIIDAVVHASSHTRFLRLDGIEGQSPDAKHPGALEIESFEWGGHNPGGAGGPELFELHFTAPVSKASPLLMNRLVNGTVIPDGDFMIRHSGGTQHTFLRLDLDNAVVSSYHVNVGGRNALVEEFTLSFPSFHLEYVPVNDIGIPQTPVPFAWDTQAQGGTTRDFAPPQRSMLHTGGMPDDGFLKIDGVVGDSTGAKHVNEIDVEGFDWVLDRAVTSGVPSGQPVFGEIQFNAPISRAAPQLMQRLASQAVSADADLVLRRSGASQHEFFKLDLDNVRVASHATGSSGAAVNDAFGLTFAALRFDYVPVNENGIAQPPVTFAYDLAASGGTAQHHSPAQRALLGAAAAPAGVQMMLGLDGVAGSSTVPGHAGEIDLIGFEWGIDREPGGRPRFGELHVVTHTSKASPTVMSRLATSQGIDGGRLVLRRTADGHEFFDVDLDGVIVSSYKLSTAAGAGLIEEFTLSFDHFEDLAPPVLLESTFRYQTAPHELRCRFSEDVSASLSLADITVEQIGGGTVAPTSLSYDAATNTATFTFAAPLPDGRYRATLAGPGITDPAGNPLQASPRFDFFFLLGDANHDGNVNLSDFNLLAANFGQSPRDFTQGDFDYNGIVNLSDFNLLAARFGTTLPASGSGGSLGEVDEDDERSPLSELLA